ncbi:MAG TPA: ABC transporter permease [Thermoplasmata archaeon]|nr:ABC transporter permease [Thermoplasmata archaeon]
MGESESAVATVAARAAERRATSRDFVHLIPMVLVAVGFVAIWEIIVRLQVWPRYLFPGPTDVVAAFVDLWNRAALTRSILATLSRLAVGFLLSLVLGAILAFLMVHFTTFGKGIQPYVLGLQTFPSIAWVPLSLVWFGFSEAALLFVTIIGSLFAVTVSFADALRTVPPIYLKAARNMGSDGMDLILRVTVPATLPHLISSAKVGWSFAWRSLVGAEVIFATVGLGFLVEQGSEGPNIAQVIAVMFVILALGVVVDRLVFSRTQEWVSRRRGLLATR